MIKIYTNIEEAERNFKAGKAIKIVNPKQIGFYAVWDCQPDFVWQGYDEKLVAYYDKLKTIHAWRKWQDGRPNK